MGSWKSLCGDVFSVFPPNSFWSNATLQTQQGVMQSYRDCSGGLDSVTETFLLVLCGILWDSDRAQCPICRISVSVVSHWDWHENRHTCSVISSWKVICSILGMVFLLWSLLSCAVLLRIQIYSSTRSAYTCILLYICICVCIYLVFSFLWNRWCGIWSSSITIKF